MEKDEMDMNHLTEGLIWKWPIIWQEHQVVNSQIDKGQMLEDEKIKDEMGKNEVARYLIDFCKHDATKNVI